MPFLVMAGWIALEAWLVTQAVEQIGGWPVAAWIVGAAVMGVLVIRQQGLRRFRELQASVARGELSTQLVFEGLIVLIAGILLIMPGFLSDIIGLSLLLFGLRKRLAVRLGEGMAKARPDLKQPVTLEGQYRRKS